MKLSKNLMRLLQVNSMTAIAADRLSPRNLTSRMLRHLYALLLLAVMTIAGSGSAWGQSLMPTTRYTLDNVGDNPFALVNLSVSKALYGKDAQNAAFDTYATAFVSANTGYTFVLEKPTNGDYDDNDYLLKFIKPDGEDYSLWGNSQCYLNSQPGGNIFILGKNGADQVNGGNFTNGQDLNDGAVWTLIANDGAFKLKNKGTNKYLNGITSVSDEASAASWSLCSLGEGLTVNFSSNNEEWGTVTAAVNGEEISSGTKVPYGTNVELTAHPKYGYVFKNWSNSSTELTRTWTVTVSGHPSATFAEAPSGYVVTFSGLYGGGTVTATVNGEPINSGDYVDGGTEVTFTAVPTGDNLPWKWTVDGAEFYTGATKAVTVEKDITVNHQFGSVYVNVYTNNASLGTVNIAHGEVNATTFHVTPYSGDFTLTAVPTANGVFKGWYKDADHTQKIEDAEATYSIHNPEGTNNYFALFAAPAHNYHPKPQCFNKPLDLTHIEAGNKVTYTYSDGATVETGDEDGYIAIYFSEAYNLKELNGWRIGCSEEQRSNVKSVGFFHNGSLVTSDYLYNNAWGRDLANDIKAQLTAVDEVRFYFNKNTTTQFNYIMFNIDHELGKKDPILVSPTANEMEIMEGSTLQLRISDNQGFWREYTDNTYSEKTNRISGEWKPLYDITGLKPGDYYFGVIDDGNCAIGNHHATELVKVHVHVNELPNCTVTTTQNSADKGTVNANGGKLDITYQHEIEGKTVTVQVKNTENVWNDHDGITCDGFRMTQANNTELLVNAPAGYRVKYVKVNFCKDSYYNVSFNGGSAIPSGTADFVEYTQNATNQYKDMVRMVIRGVTDQTECTELHINSVYVKIERMKLDEDRTITSSGRERKYWIYVPENVMKGTAKNVPVVFSLHGGGEDYKPTNIASLNFNTLADQNNFIVVYPCAENQLFPLFNPNPAPAWLCTGKKNDDTQLFEDIIEELNNNTEGYSIDETKIYMAGFSVGGMMAYAAANCMSDKIAAFASISGFPMNETHLRHHGKRPVPFLHVHGTKDDFVRYTHMPTIIDNMIFRNGLSSTPAKTTGSADLYGDQTTTFTKYVYGNESDKSQTPYVYYEVGTGFGSGMGHNDWCRLGDDDVEKVMWNFFSGRSLPNTISEQWEIKTDINTQNFSGLKNGWQINTSTGVLAQYGESGGYTNTGQNVYHSIQLKGGQQYLKFNITGNATNYIMVRVVKLAELSAFDELRPSPISYTEKVILDNKAYKVKENGSLSIPFDAEEGEYLVSIMKGGQYDNTTINNIVISQTGSKDCEEYTGAINTDFTGYFNYNNRLFAQWNFDLSDGYRTNARKLEENARTDADMWHADLSNTNYVAAHDDIPAKEATFGTIIFENQKVIGNLEASDTDIESYGELTYNCTGETLEPLAIAAGLKFKAGVGQVKIHVDLANGQVSGAHLELAAGVKMHIPYVENSYRNDKNENKVIPSGDGANLGDFSNCMHHINRDIIYIAMKEGNVWQYITNKCLDEDHTDQDLFRSGGDEFVNGKTYNKADYMGIQGTPCFVEFNKTGVIDRIGVNRNMIYSFYTEYINELGMAKPNTRFRVVGSPWGSRVADEGVYTKYEGAIAMTYGGWMNSEGGSTYTKWDDTETTDAWSDLGVINYEPDNTAVHFKTWGNMKPSQAGTKSIAAIDGFPVAALLYTEARSGSLLPSSLAPANSDKKTDNNIEYVKAKDDNGAYVLNENQQQVWLPNYFPECPGEYMVPTTSAPYKENVTPWSLPSRGGYAKFEPSIPGVLNMNVVQNGGHDYYIADEFGKLVDQNTIFSITGTKQAIDKSNGCYKIANTDYVKHSLNVEPGKTYYIFSNTTGLGIVGFYFEPYVNHDGTERGRIYVGVNEEAYKLKAGEAYALPANVNRTETITSPGENGDVSYTIKYSQKAVKVNLRRAFNANQWETICLPYSMNQVQMEQVFGEGTRVVLLRDVQDQEHSVDNKVTMTLVCHENQDILAGYPYLIRPTQPVPNGVETISSLPTTAPTPLVINSVGPNTNSYADKTYGGMTNWNFKGHYSGSVDVANGSYVVSQGVLKLVAGTTKISGYRAWMENAIPSQLKRVQLFIGADGEEDDSATDVDEISIDDLLEQSGIFTNESTVYGINGQVVRKNATNLNGLPKGIYVVNGKKYIIK